MGKVSGIYLITSGHAEPRFYVGQSVDTEAREIRHFRDLAKGVHKNAKLQRAYDKYGATFFQFSLVLVSPRDSSLLSRYEQAILDFYANTYGADRIYNIRQKCVDSRLGLKSTPTHRAKIAAKLTGITRSAETRQRISLAKKGKQLSPVHAESLRLRALGRPMPPHVRECLRIAKLGKKKSPADLAKRHQTRLANASARGYY